MNRRFGFAAVKTAVSAVALVGMVLFAVSALAGCNKVNLEGTTWKSDDLTDFFLVFNSPQKVSMKIDSNTESGEYTISGNKVTITFSGETLKGTISGNKLSLPKNDNIMTFTKLSGEVAATTAMPSQDFVGKWGDGNDFIKINSISNDAIDFEWSVPNRGIETTGTAKIEGNRIVFVTNGGDFSGTMAFDGNGISLTVEKTGWPKIDAGAKWVYANKNEQGTKSGGDISLPPVIDLFQYQKEYSPSNASDYRFWGWSKDGKVAYSYDFSDGGETASNVRIFNFIKDKEILSKSFSKNYYYEAGNKLDENNKKNEMITNHNAFLLEFSNACKANGIESVKAEYRKLPVVHNKKTYNVVVDMDKRELNPLLGDPDIGGTDLLIADSYRIMVDTDGKRKVVHNAKTEYPYYNIFPLGYFISPFENRALLVMGKHVVGGYVPTFFVGCDLEGGFKAVDAEVVKLSFEPFVDVKYHEYTCEGKEWDRNIVISSTVPLKDFRYVRFDYRDIGHIGGDELERRVVTLYKVGELRPEKPLLIKNFTVAGPTDAKGITFIDADGERRNYRILEDSIGDSGNPYIMVRVD